MPLTAAAPALRRRRENDAPFAAKGHIVAAAFLGIELQCARCHDSPYHSTTAARSLFARRDALAQDRDRSRDEPGAGRFLREEGPRIPHPRHAQARRTRHSRLALSPTPPEWRNAAIDRLVEDPQDSRERFAALVTSPENRRFPRVIVNRVWKRLMGAGFVEPAQDWEGRDASHPELLDWLAGDFIAQTTTSGISSGSSSPSPPINANQARRIWPHRRRRTFFQCAPARRRLSAEQIVDSLHTAAGAGHRFRGAITFVHDGSSYAADGGRISACRVVLDVRQPQQRTRSTQPRAAPCADRGRCAGGLRMERLPANARLRARHRPERPPARHPRQRHSSCRISPAASTAANWPTSPFPRSRPKRSLRPFSPLPQPPPLPAERDAFLPC
jgi:hypothetical protein